MTSGPIMPAGYVACAVENDDRRAQVCEIVDAQRPQYRESVTSLAHQQRINRQSLLLLVCSDVDDRPAAYLNIGRTIFSPDSPYAWCDIVVREAHRDAGIEEALYVAASEWAYEHGYTGLRAMCMSTEQTMVEFWTGHGFSEVERGCDVSLTLDGITVPDHPLPPGVTATTLAQRPDLYEQMYELSCETLADAPSAEPEEMPPLEEYRLLQIESPGYRPDALFLALDDTDRAIAISELELQDGTPGVAWYAFTGVRREWRGKGIAWALKGLTIRWAVDLGLRELRTENEARNAAMRHINQVLGFRPLPDRITFFGPLHAQTTDQTQIHSPHPRP